MMPLDRYRARLEKAKRLDDVLQIVRSGARQLAGSQGATFVLREGDACFYADEDSIAPLWKGQRFPMLQCISGWAMLHRESAVIPDITLDERIPQDAYRPTYVRSLAMVPIRRHEPLGAIGVYWATVHRASPQLLADLEALAELAGRALDRIGLHDAPWAPTFSRRLVAAAPEPIA